MTTVTELKKIAKDRNVKGYSKMKKAELLTVVSQNTEIEDIIKKMILTTRKYRSSVTGKETHTAQLKKIKKYNETIESLYDILDRKFPFFNPHSIDLSTKTIPFS